MYSRYSSQWEFTDSISHPNSDSSNMATEGAVNMSNAKARALLICMLLVACTATSMTQDDDASEDQTLTTGRTEFLDFHLRWIAQPRTVPYFTIRFESKGRPFYVYGRPVYLAGLLSYDQFERFTVSKNSTNSTLNVKLTISDVQLYDGDTYIVTLILYGASQTPFRMTTRKRVTIYDPPGRAQCYVTLSEYADDLMETHCFATAGNGNATLSCFQHGSKIPYMGAIYIIREEVRGVFWGTFGSPVSCCSHERNKPVTQNTCTHFTWPPIPTTIMTTYKPPIQPVTTVTARYDPGPGGRVEDMGSGSSGSFTLSSITLSLKIFIVILMSLFISKP